MEIIASSKNPGDLSAIYALPSTIIKMVHPEKVDAYIANLTKMGYNCHRFAYQNSFRVEKTVHPFQFVAAA